MDIWNDHSQAARKMRWQQFWAMEELPRPIWLVPNSPVLVQGIAMLERGESIRPLLTDRTIQYETSIAFVRAMEEAQKSFAFDDAVNHLQPYQGVPIFASAFGTPIEFFENQLPASRPLIFGEEARDRIAAMPPPAVHDAMLGEILDMTSYFARRSGNEFPIAVTDLQSPMDTAYLVWNSCDFMVAMYTDPDSVHRLMRLCTDLFIDFVKAMRSRVSEFIPVHFPPAYLPDGEGVALSEDTLAVLSAALFEELTLPYLNEVSEEFGGLFIHSCGNIAHQLGSLKKVRGLKGLNFSVSATHFAAVWDALSETCCILPHCSDERIVRSYASAEEWITDVMAIAGRNRGLALIVYPDRSAAGTGGRKGSEPEAASEPESFPAFMLRIEALIRRLAGS